MAIMAETTIPEIIGQNPGKPSFVAEFGTGTQFLNKFKKNIIYLFENQIGIGPNLLC